MSENDTQKKKVALAMTAVFFAYFISMFLMNGVNIARPVQVGQLNGMSQYSLMVALSGLGSAVATLLFGKLSDMYGRRPIIVASLVFFTLGNVVSAVGSTMMIAIIGAILMALGSGSLAPLSFSVIGDLFPPEQRATWSGWLNLPAGIAATLAPTIGGMITDMSASGWRTLYWIFVPLTVIAGIMAALWLPKKDDVVKAKIDVLGVVVVTAATALMIFGVPMLGIPAQRTTGIILTVLSIAGFFAFIQVEKKAEAPVLSIEVMTNRTFITAALAGFLSLFGMLGIMIYGPVFAQTVMGVDATLSGTMITPYSMLMTFMGIPAGIMLAKTKKYKWMYNGGYTLLSICMFVMWQFNADTPVWLFVVVTGVAGFALGTIPTVNTLVAQFAVPPQMIGSAVGAIFFFVMMGMAVGPAFLGLAQISGATPEAGFSNLYLVGAILMVISTIMIYTIPGDAMEKASMAPPPPAPEGE